jgi:tetratricopeptide (TPR) repeat protein
MNRIEPMRFLKIFFGKAPREYERRGDTYFNHGSWGHAKIQYETALVKLEKKSSTDDALKIRLLEKIHQSKEALALEHKQSGDQLIAAKYYKDAFELYSLALELTDDPQLKAELENRLQQRDRHLVKKEQKSLSEIELPDEEVIESATEEPGDEYFGALCSTLPTEVRKAYLSYGTAFKNGYIALNQGNFELAATLLSQSMKENSSTESYIALELATAHLNLDKYNTARLLLESFVKNHPHALPGYQLLCEIFWETHEFDQVEKLLSSCPEELKESVAVFLLRGETLYRAQKYLQAKSFYLDFLKSYGWHESIARALAKTYEAMGELENARDFYQKIMGQGRSCGFRVDPIIKRKYADLCFESGQYTTEILELYLSLVQEDPQNAAEYYEKISRIYAIQGNKKESRRFRLFVDKRHGKDRRNH